MNIIFLTISNINSIKERGIYADLMRKFRNQGHNVYIVSPAERRTGIRTHVIDVDGVRILKVKTLNIQKTNVIEKGVGTLLVESQFKNAIKKHFGGIGGGKIVKASSYKEIIGDDTTETAKLNYEIIKKFSQEQIIFGGNYFTDFLYPSRCWIVWDKKNTCNFADAELAWTSYDKSVKLYTFTWNGLVREGSKKVEGAKRVHPTQKPVGLIINILNDFKSGDECETILDCFGGSGSTLIACEQLNLKCYMMELDPYYVDVIIKRWENLTGKKSEKLN